MNKVLYELFDALDEDQISPEEIDALEKAEPICAQVRDKLTWEELDQLWCSAFNVGAVEVKNSFSKGFRLGARVMMAVLQG